MKVERTRTEISALAVLREAGEDLMAAAIIAKESMEAGRGKLKRARCCIAAGVEELKRQERTVYDFRYFTRRFMKHCPGLARRKVRAISAQECEQYIEMAFDTPR